MKPSIQTLGHILYSPSQYVIPVFQRNYRWERTQWEKLWESLVEIRRPEKKGNHFMGFLVFVPGLAQPGEHTSFHLIDGQQRLSTASIVLAAIRNVARHAGQVELADEINEEYLIHPRKHGEQRYRLLPKERDHDSYVALISGEGAPTGRVADAFDYFKERLEDLAADNPEDLRVLFHTVCQRLEFMCATLEGENAYNIFKSLNSTGVPLDSSDLIRNFVFMHVAPEEHDHFDEVLWQPLEKRFQRSDGVLDEARFSGFFRDYLMSAGRYLSPGNVFASFEERYAATNFSAVDLAGELLANAKDYAAISGEATDESPAVTSAISRLNKFESSTTYPLLLNFFQRRRRGEADHECLAKLIDMLSGFIVRRFVCGEGSRGYGQIFVRAIPQDKVEALEQVENYLIQRGWPDTATFKSRFVEFSLYRSRYPRQVLELIERARGHKEPPDLSSAQVEHVLPQTLNEDWRESLGSQAENIQAEWLHRPGNLTLSAYNIELWNYGFPIKRKRYAESNVGITRELDCYDEWSEAQIRKRGERLAEEAAQLWSGPMEPPSQRIAIEEGNDFDRQELRLRFWSGLSDFLANDYPHLPHIEPRPNWTLRLPSGVRHIGLETRVSLRHLNTGIDIWFWREASIPIWEQAKASPAPYYEAVAEEWQFEQIGGRTRVRMYLDHDVPGLKTESSWADAYSWLASKLTNVYDKIVPILREEMDRQEALI